MTSHVVTSLFHALQVLTNPLKYAKTRSHIKNVDLKADERNELKAVLSMNHKTFRLNFRNQDERDDLLRAVQLLLSSSPNRASKHHDSASVASTSIVCEEAINLDQKI